MINRKIEGTPRSELFLRATVYQPLLAEPGSFYPLVNEKSLELARLFQREELLAALINDNEAMVDKDTVYEIVAIARKIAAKGYSTNLVPLDEMLDIAHLYYLDEPTIEPHTVPSWASRNLVNLLGNLQEKENLAWTARVAAALAYFSNLQGPSS